MLNAYRLQEIGKGKDLGRNVAEAYTLEALSNYIRIESVMIIALLAIAVASIALVFTGSAAYMALTVVVCWLASIAYRFLRMHRRAFWHMLNVASQTCPHCGKSLESHGIADHEAEPVKS